MSQKKGQIPLEDRFGTIHKNGYISKTMRSLLIGGKGRLEWIGEGFFAMKDPEKDPFSYSVIA